MKKIFFVRHGESEGNVAKTHQSLSTPLTEIGLSQAKMLALRFSKIQASLIIASPCLRAQQTAQAIADKNNLKIETNDLLIEKKLPSQLSGLAHHSELSKKVRTKIHSHLFEQSGRWRHSDEETAFEFVQRTKQILQYLAQRPEEKLIVTSHALTLKMTFAQILYPEGGLEDLYAMYQNFDLNNTGLSVASYDEAAKKWQLVCLNDHSHL